MNKKCSVHIRLKIGRIRSHRNIGKTTAFIRFSRGYRSYDRYAADCKLFERWDFKSRNNERIKNSIGIRVACRVIFQIYSKYRRDGERTCL